MEPILIWMGIFFCLSQSAILSGLDLACFSVSRVQLEMESSENNQDAIKVLALRRDSNFLLTTVLWGNMGSNTLLALLSGSVLGGIAAFVFSTVFLTIFAEILPQAYFSRHALRVAALLSPILRFYQFILYPVAKPTAKFLDLWLGSEGVHYVSEKNLTKYIVKSMATEDSDIGAFEGAGAINFLALDSRCVGEEGNIVDPASIVSLPLVDGHLEIPEFECSPGDSFINRVQAAGKKWVILTDPDDTPHLLLNADRFLRAVFSGQCGDAHNAHNYCVRPVITNNPIDTLEQVLMKPELAVSVSTKKEAILLWGAEKRIIADADMLKLLFGGVFSAAPSPKQGGV
jgi:metal transporter CNNM